MIGYHIHLIVTLLALSFVQHAFPQVDSIILEDRESSVQGVADLIRDRYVFEELGAKVADSLLAASASGRFNDISQVDELCDRMTELIYRMTDDKHMTVSPLQLMETHNTIEETMVERKLSDHRFLMRYNANFKSVTKLEGNVGYLEHRGFYPLSSGKKYADMALAQLATSDAIIIDLRQNSGGRPEMVDYMAGHFFRDPIRSLMARRRAGNERPDDRKPIEVGLGDERLFDIPLFILMSDSSFSAAEAFAYELQAQGRATIVGATSKGGANGGNLLRVNDRIQVFVPDVQAYHPLTDGNWEGVGVIPDVPTGAGSAYDTAYDLAKTAAEHHRSEMEKMIEMKLLAFEQLFEGEIAPSTAEELAVALEELEKEEVVFEEWELWSLAYDRAFRRDRMDSGTALVRAMTLKAPESAFASARLVHMLIRDSRYEQALDEWERRLSVLTQGSGNSLRAMLASDIPLEEVTTELKTQEEIGMTYNEYDLNALGYGLLASTEKKAKGIAVLLLNVLLSPTSPNAHDSAADALESVDRNEEALTHRRKAVQLAKEIDDPNLPLYMENLEKAED